MGRILVACEESQAVCLAFRERGYKAWSCDLSPCSGGHPEWHIQGDVAPVLGGSWDMILAFPPCTHLCASGARWWPSKVADGSQRTAVDFFLLFARHPCPRIAIENPIGLMSSVWRKPDQIIQPWQYGHGETKATCLWLKGLPTLVPTNIVTGRVARVHRMPDTQHRARLRSLTYAGVAAAMADQWGRLLEG
jgi:hypothetical protein